MFAGIESGGDAESRPKQRMVCSCVAHVKSERNACVMARGQSAQSQKPVLEKSQELCVLKDHDK